MNNKRKRKKNKHKRKIKYRVLIENLSYKEYHKVSRELPSKRQLAKRTGHNIPQRVTLGTLGPEGGRGNRGRRLEKNRHDTLL
jgi:hypothetical protein